MLTRRAGLLFLVASTIWAENAAETQFKAIYTKEWAFRQSQNSEQAGGDGLGGRRGVNPHLPAVSAKTQEARTAYWTDVLTQLGNIDRATLSPAEQIDFDVYRNQIQVLLNNQRFREFEKPLNADTAFLVEHYRCCTAAVQNPQGLQQLHFADERCAALL